MTRSASRSCRPITVRQSKFHWHLDELDIRHVYIRPRTPRLNGKVERSHRIDNDEFYRLLDKGDISDDIHLMNKKVSEWERYYNHHRPHGGLNGQTPFERFIERTKNLSRKSRLVHQMETDLEDTVS